MNPATRTSRGGWKSCLLGAATVTALLTSAACSPSGGDGKPTARPGAPGATAVAACAPVDVSIIASAQDQEGDGLHFLLTLTNTSEKPCKVFRYPLVLIADSQRLSTEVKDSTPIPWTAYETIAPGKQTYAALLQRGSMDVLQPETERTITVQLQDTDPGSRKGESIKIDFPGTSYVCEGDFSQITHWMTSADLALHFINTS
ncbi:DUF4232 domain-containing protein [Streptomyces sp. NBC_01298]|uniref:DUF4232 domain-containing protein n=1 Tax=Streptomyces sp. NBC_01298 TaxID=2903817 RepID=UPI002E0DD261|nr:DUF4232 domain-containing protein [Streptomyces sp. NBC_01298]